MEEIRLKNDPDALRSELKKCLVCDSYIYQQEGFSCPKCKRSPLCNKHAVVGRKECASCVFDIIKKDLNLLRAQKSSLRSFVAFLQFVFLLCCVIFIALKSGASEYVEFLHYPELASYVIYFGITLMAGYILCLIFLYNQRRNIGDLEHKIRKIEIRR